MRPEANALRSVLHHGLLADQLAEGPWPVFAGERRVALGAERSGGASALPLAGRLRALFLIFGVGH